MKRILSLFARKPRVLIRTATGLPPEDMARIFAEWPADDQRLAAVFQLIQEQLDNAQGDVAAHRHDPAKLTADAGACNALELLLGEMAQRVSQPKPHSS